VNSFAERTQLLVHMTGFMKNFIATEVAGSDKSGEVSQKLVDSSQIEENIVSSVFCTS